MESTLKDGEIRSLVSYLISEQFLYYANTEDLPFPRSVNVNSLRNPYFTTATKSTDPNSSIAGYLQSLSDPLRDNFHPVFDRAFPSHVKNETDFFKYSLSFCGRVYRNFMQFCANVRSRRPSWPYVFFLVAFVFVAEFALFCFRKKCFRFATTAKNCVLVVYSRYFREYLYSKEDLSLLSSVCAFRLKAAEKLTHLLSSTDIFVNVSLHENWDTFDKMIVSPVREFLDMKVETILAECLPYDEKPYVVSSYLLRGRYSNNVPCEFCKYGCIVHLQSLLQFEFVSNE